MFFSVDLALVHEAKIELVAHLLMHRACDGDAAGLRDALDTRRNIHAVAHQVVALDHDVADMNTDAQRQATLAVGFLVSPWRSSPPDTALANSIRKPSPTDLNSRPPCLAIWGSMISVRSASS